MDPAAPGHPPPHRCADAVALWHRLQCGDIDAALDAGLMRFAPCPACPAGAAAGIGRQQRRLAQAWAARDRYRGRQARLERLRGERDAGRTALATERKSALPPAAAAVLARAKARAAGTDPR